MSQSKHAKHLNHMSTAAAANSKFPALTAAELKEANRQLDVVNAPDEERPTALNFLASLSPEDRKAALARGAAFVDSKNIDSEVAA